MRSTLIPAKFVSRLVPLTRTHTKKQVAIHLVITVCFQVHAMQAFGLGGTRQF
ncbi:hypothetical protein CY34DRAFT_437693 [Suillus luteus UH-Slu-Lm8-n1]|uniref:Uncharacterized protein n=1 Tax=Suillus luteus UH-Slu-Lm8-n1 TaxID=930992 RepID=A0A0D0BHU1_9AGAM|nr:hypothetical protein CY34DRAFT_437693 [Suillus luteus UH-Slu-Lm8-n1]